LRRGVYPRGGSALRSLLHRQAFAVRTPNQYADFVWQAVAAREVLDTQLNYWKQQLNGAKMVLELPTDRPRSHVQTPLGQSTLRTLPSLSALRSLSQQEGVTLFMTLLAAFNTLLYRYTGQEDILVGSPIANRNRSETEGLALSIPGFTY